MLAEPGERIRAEAVMGVVSVDAREHRPEASPEVLAAMRALSRGTCERARFAVAYCALLLGELAEPVGPDLVAMVADEGSVGLVLAEAIGRVRLRDSAAIARLGQLLGHRDSMARAAAARSLALLGNAAHVHVPKLLELLRDDQEIEFRREAHPALARLARDPADVEQALRIALRDRVPLMEGEGLHGWITSSGQLTANAPQSDRALLTLEILVDLEAEGGRAHDLPPAVIAAAIARISVSRNLLVADSSRLQQLLDSIGSAACVL